MPEYQDIARGKGWQEEAFERYGIDVALIPPQFRLVGMRSSSLAGEIGYQDADEVASESGRDRHQAVVRSPSCLRKLVALNLFIGIGFEARYSCWWPN